MYQHILLAVDGSENAIRAAKEAVKIAQLSADSIIEIVFVVDFDQSKKDLLHAKSSDALLLERRKTLYPIEQLLKEAIVTYKVTILHGTPGPVIVDYTNKQKADLIVLGSRGLNSLQEMVLGSVSHKIMKRVTCPALIVK